MLIRLRMPEVRDFVTWLNCYCTTNLIYSILLFLPEGHKQINQLESVLYEFDSVPIKNKKD